MAGLEYSNTTYECFLYVYILKVIYSDNFCPFSALLWWTVMMNNFTESCRAWVVRVTGRKYDSISNSMTEIATILEG
jgi:hypothetical protein